MVGGNGDLLGPHRRPGRPLIRAGLQVASGDMARGHHNALGQVSDGSDLPSLGYGVGFPALVD